MNQNPTRSSLWSRLTRPHPEVTDPHFNRILGLVAAWHLVTIPLGPLLAGLQVIFGEPERVQGVWLYVAPITTLVNYLLTRSRWGQKILWLQVWSTFGIVVAAMFVAPDRAATSFALVLPVLAAALCFGLRHVLLVQGLALLVVGVNVSQSEPVERGSYIGMGVVLLAAFAIIAAMVRHRSWLYATSLRQLTEEAARARALLSAGFDGTADVLNGRLSQVTEGFGRALGVSASELEGQRVEEALLFAWSQEAQRQDAVPFLDRDGALRYLSVIRQALPGENCCSEVIAIRDETHEQLHKANLQFTDRMASIGTLASGVAHEVNNALMALSGHGEVGAIRLREGNTAEAASSFAAIAESAERIADCVKQLQRFGEGVDSELENIDINDVVASTVRLAEHQVRHVADIQLELAPALPQCKAVDSWVGQVVMNLLLNALDALRDTETAQIHVSTGMSGEIIWVRVADNGPGVSDEMAAKIFQPFFTTKANQGSGLGLSISASLASRMNGSLTLEQGDSGARFLMRLPVAHSEAVAQDNPLELIVLTPDHRILVVDDEPAVLQVLEGLLSPARVTKAGTVAEAKALWDDDFDLVLSDIVMPRESGLDLREWVADQHPEGLAKLILMTGSAVGHHDGLRDLPESQVVLYKPIHRHALLGAISAVVDSK